MSKTDRRKRTSKKSDAAVVVAIIGLIGTLTAAILNSPLILKLAERSSAPEAAGTTAAAPVFDENFDDNFANGFGFELGTWEVVKEGDGFILRGTATEPDSPAGKAYFGPGNFSDGAIEFRVKFLTAPGIYLDFRLQAEKGGYVFNFSPQYQAALLAKNTYNHGDWDFAAVSTESGLSYTIQQDAWYDVRVEAMGGQIVVIIDGNLVLSETDSSFAQGRVRFALEPNAVAEFDDVRIWTAKP